MKMYVGGVDYKHLTDVLLNICFCGEIRKIFIWALLLSGAMLL